MQQQQQQQQSRNVDASASSSIGGRKMSASFGQPGMSERISNFQPIQSPASIPHTGNSTTHGSAHKHVRVASDVMQTSSQRTEPAQNPMHIIQGNYAVQNMSRKHSDFSFASGSLQKGGDSSARSPRLPGSNQASSGYSGQFLERQRSGSNQNLRGKNLNSDGSLQQNNQLGLSYPVGQSPQASGVSNGSSQRNLIGANRNFSQVQQQQPSGNPISSIQEEQHELDYGSQLPPSSSEQTMKGGQSSSSVAVAQFMNNTGSTNVVFSGSQRHSHLNSLGATSNTLMPQIYSQDGTPTSMPLQPNTGKNTTQQFAFPNNTAYVAQPGMIGAQRNSAQSIGESTNSYTLLSVKCENANRYAELCERRLLDYQPDHPLPVREEHLGTLFAGFDQNGTTSDPRSLRSGGSPPVMARSQRNPINQRGGFENNNNAQNNYSPSLGTGTDKGSPRALKQRADSLSQKNHQLEVALREETLANEEQRNYIQILKNVIEQKLERDGLLEMLKESSAQRKADQQKLKFINQQQQRSGRRASPSPDPPIKDDQEAINLYVVLSDMKHQLDSKGKEVSRFIEQLKTQDEHTRQLLEENKQCYAEIEAKNAHADYMEKRYQEFESELSLLHKQKEDLLDCVESQVNQIESLKQDLEQSRSGSTATLPQNQQQQQIRGGGSTGEMRQTQTQQTRQSQQTMQSREPSPDNQQNMHQQPYSMQNPQIMGGLSSGADYYAATLNEATQQSIMPNGIELSYSREVTDVNQTNVNNQTMTAQQQQQNALHMQQITQLQRQQQELAEQVRIVNQAAINAAQQSLTQNASQESVPYQGSSNQTPPSVLTSTVEQYQRQLSSKDQQMSMKEQEIIRLRGQLEELSSEMFAKQQEHESLTFNKNQLQKRLEMETEKNNQQEECRSKQLDNAQSMFYGEQRKTEDLQMHYEAEVRKCQRELNIIREEYAEKDSQLEQISKSLERQTKEIELKETQLESCRNQASKDIKEIRELKLQMDDAQLECDRLRKDRERRQDTELTDGKTKEQLGREKHLLVTQLNELQHQFEIFKTQKQTESHRQDQLVRDAQTRVDVLEKATKKQIVENETLQRDYTSCAVKLKQGQVQSGYLESSNKQMMDELRQTKLEFDDTVRQKSKMEAKANEALAEVGTLQMRDSKNRKLYEQITEAQLETKRKECEIEKLDTKLRKVYLMKEEFEVEATQLRKTVHELKISKNEYLTQKEMLSSQTKDNERRIYDLIRDKQDLDKKVRENVILIQDLVAERDKYKHLVDDKEEEIVDLGMQVKQWRSSNTDLKLIEEKVDGFLADIKHVTEQIRHRTKPQLQEFLRLVKASDSLSQKLTMRKREQGHDLYNALDERVIKPAQLEGDVTSQIWQTMIVVKDQVTLIGDVQDYLAEMLEVFVADTVDLNQQLTYKERTVSNLEGKLGTIHSIDFKAQTDSQNLKKELLELKQIQMNTDSAQYDQIQKLQQSLEEKTLAEQELQDQIKKLSQKHSKSLYDTKAAFGSTAGQSRKLEKELTSATAEKRRFEEVLEKIMTTILAGTQAQVVVDEMRTSSKKLATVDATREALLTEIDELEIRLSEVNNNQQQKQQQEAQSSHKSTEKQITAIQKVKNLRKELTLKEDQVKEIDDHIEREADRMKSLGRELKMLGSSQNNNLTYTSHQQNRRNNSMSKSPHRQTDVTSPVRQQQHQQETGYGGRGDRSYTTSHLPRLDRSTDGGEDLNSKNQTTTLQERPARDYRPAHEYTGYGETRPSQKQYSASFGNETDGTSKNPPLHTHQMATLLNESKDIYHNRR